MNDNTLIKDFFQMIFDKNTIPKGFIELRMIDRKNNIEREFIDISSIDEIPSIIQSKNGKTNCYFGVAVRDTANNGKKENCSYLTALFVDIDYGTDSHKKRSFLADRETTLKLIERFPYKPNMIIDSGHGFHLYWQLKEPLKLESNSIELAESTMKSLSKLLGGDTTSDVTRILRVPYSLNVKSEKAVKCEYVGGQEKIKYDLDQLSSNLNNYNVLQILKNVNKEYLYAIFGSNDFNNDDRSEVDQKIIHHLLSKNADPEEIVQIFEIYPTTGKYHERAKTDIPGAEKYLHHSIKKAQEYIKENTNTNKTRIYKMETIQTENNQIHQLEGNLAVEHDTEPNVPFEEIGTYAQKSSTTALGYYVLINEEYKRLSNFIITFDNQVHMEVEKQSQTILNGTVALNNKEIYTFSKLQASTLASYTELTKFLTNLCGTKIAFYSSAKSHLIEIIKSFNRSIKTDTALELGYNKILTEYRTPNLRITKDEVEEVKSPILYSQDWDGMDVNIPKASKEEINQVKEVILNKFLAWDEPSVTYPMLGFTFAPIIYPFVKKDLEGKPFLMLKGPSGCGKTTMIKLAQNFYTTVTKLPSWTSTSTSLNSIGHSFKDMLMPIDDFKVSNFYNDREKLRAQTTLQNYSDGHSRSRSNTSLTIRDEKFMRGFITISAEDIVLTEASTIARGIIIDVKNKNPKLDEVNEINGLANSFSKITADYIRYALKNYDDGSLNKILSEYKDRFLKMAKEENLSNDNLPRLINNFSLIALSLKLVLSFLLIDKAVRINYFEIDYVRLLFDLFMINDKRLESFKPEEKFEEIFWMLLDERRLIAEDVNAQYRVDNAVMYYKKQPDNSLKISINLRKAYKDVNNYLSDQGGLGISLDSLRTKLVQIGKIKLNGSKRVSLGDFKHRGEEWIGEIPEYVRTIDAVEESAVVSHGPYKYVPSMYKSSPGQTNDDDLPF